MDLFSNFCNICYKIDNGSLKDISKENMKHLNNTLINFVGHTDIPKHNVIYLCHLCREELTRFEKFRQMCFNNLIQFRQRYFNMKTKLELEEDASAVKNALENFVHEEVLRRSSFEESNSPVLFSTGCQEIIKRSANLNKDPVFHRQVINLQSARNELNIVGDCNDVSVMNSVAQCDAFGVAFTNENDVRNEMVRRSEDAKLKKFETNSNDDFYDSDINNGNENETSQIEFVKVEFDLKNEIDLSDSEHFTLETFPNESDEHSNVDVNMPALKNSEGNVNAEIHVKQEPSSQGLELQTTEDEFGNGVNDASEIVNVCTIVNMEDCAQQNITDAASKVEKKFRSGDCNNKSIISTQPSGSHEREYVNVRNRTALQSDVHERPYPDAEPHTCAVCNQSLKTNSFVIRHDCRHINARPYKCTICNETFAESSSLPSHVRTHSADKSYKCSICNNAFKKLSKLLVHERTHSGERPYKCSICNKTFTETYKLTKHERIHSGDKPYKCSVCNKAFADSGNLIVHERIHTGDRPYKCTDCNKTFTKSSNLTKHKRTHSADKPYKFGHT